MTSAGSVGGDDRLRLFLALELPAPTLDVLDAILLDGVLVPAGMPGFGDFLADDDVAAIRAYLDARRLSDE